MGKLLSKETNSLQEIDKTKVLLIGLVAGGKSTIMEKIATTKIEENMPTVGWIIKSFDFNNLSFTSFSLFKNLFRVFLKSYYEGVKGIVFVIDSNDKDRIDEVKYEVNYFLSIEELKDADFLFLANKQDFPDALTVQELTDILELDTIQYRNWHIQPTWAVTLEGVYEGIDWLSKTLENKLY